ncbi:hypothetical protein glysoja_038568 [Glycine soja]|uniref:Uncharacterized protein n=1 Tax=Glycine soja TaxID=3848 RepID=A0A0B2SIF2_GLYSO|nr:hypothetical protein glysoja_038568 [Glycine soja]
MMNKNYFSLFVQHQWLPHVVAIPRPKCASSRFSAAIPYPPNNNNNKNPFQPKGVGIDLNLRFFFVTETEESESSRSDYDNASATTQTNNNKGFLENIVEVLEKLDNNNNINNHERELVVRSKRGRNHALSYQFRDSIMEPWKCATRSRRPSSTTHLTKRLLRSSLTMKRVAKSSCRGQCSWIWSQGP